MNRIAFEVSCPCLLVVLFLTGLGGTSQFCRGAEPPSVSTNTQPATLEALVADVVEHNPELNFYRAEIAAAKGERRTAATWANPEVATTLGQTSVRGGYLSAVEIQFRIVLHHIGDERLKRGGLRVGAHGRRLRAMTKL